MSLKVVEKTSSTARIDSPTVGEAFEIKRFRETKAYVVHPDDFAALTRAASILERLGQLAPPKLTSLESRLLAASQDASHDPRDVADDLILD